MVAATNTAGGLLSGAWYGSVYAAWPFFHTLPVGCVSSGLDAHRSEKRSKAVGKEGLLCLPCGFDTR